jgi:hypothetical protein
MAARGGEAQMRDLYRALEQRLDGNLLSDQGKVSLRFFVNEVAVRDGYIFPYDRRRPGWRLTKKGYELARCESGPSDAGGEPSGITDPDDSRRFVTALCSALALAEQSKESGKIGREFDLAGGAVLAALSKLEGALAVPSVRLRMTSDGDDLEWRAEIVVRWSRIIESQQ